MSRLGPPARRNPSRAQERIEHDDDSVARLAPAKALAPGILIAILAAAGSIFIMANLNENMMPMPELPRSPMHH